MKDYSQYIHKSYGFITHYEIQNDEILVYTAQTINGEPHRYTLNAGTLHYVEERMKNQYKLLLENREIIKTDFLKQLKEKLLIIYGAVGSVSLGVGCAFALALMNLLPLLAGAVLPVTFALGIKSHLKKQSKKFDAQLDTYQIYLNNMEDIETVNKKDGNVVKYLSKESTRNLREKDKLCEKGLIDNKFNIDLMDKLELKELKKLINRYLISKELGCEQYFVPPVSAEENKNTKKRIKKDNK